jgi:tyrosinase
VWDYRKLGYAYLPDNATDLQVAGVPIGPGAAASNTLRSGVPVASFPLRTLDPDFTRAELRFQGLTPPEDSFAIHVFADVNAPDANTATDDNPNYLGTRYFFGHGECGGAPGHCEVVPRDIYDLRPAHHYAPVTVRLDITRRLKAFIATRKAPVKGSGNEAITLVVIGRDGQEISEPALYFEGLSIVVR